MSGPIRTQSLLPNADCDRIFRVIHGALLAEKSRPTKACLYFSVAGAYILCKHFGLQARPVVGAAAYWFAGDNVICFGEQTANGIQATENGFHCWVEADGWALDFQAPLFSDHPLVTERGIALPRQVVQAPLTAACSSLAMLGKTGAYWYAPDGELHASMLSTHFDSQFNVDFVQRCAKWFKPWPRSIEEELFVGDQSGRRRQYRLSPLRVESAS
jgi:hypothetical protein